MECRIALLPEGNGGSGPVKLAASHPDGVVYGLTVGYWLRCPQDNNIHILLYDTPDTIIHEVATSKAVTAELRAAERDLEGEEVKPVILFNPETKRFTQV